MTGKNYTFYIASTPGKMRKLVVPSYLLHGLAALAIIGAVSCYSRGRFVFADAVEGRKLQRPPSRSGNP